MSNVILVIIISKMKKLWESTNIFKYLTFLSIICFMSLVVAKSPNYSQMVNSQGGKVIFKEGNKPRRYAKRNERLEKNNQKLIIKGNKKNLARLILRGPKVSYNGSLLQIGPSSTETQYQFSCISENGKFTIGWKKGTKSDGCGEGMYVRRPKNQRKNHLKNLFAHFPTYEEEEIIIKPAQEEDTLVQIYIEENQQIVTPLIKDIVIISPDDPNGKRIKEGQQWTYNSETNQESINSIDPQSILDSPELQDFLTPENWHSDSLSMQVNSEVKEQITALQEQGKEIGSINCASEKGLTSTESNISTFINFRNNSSQSLQIFWINFDGQRIKYADLEPGQEYKQQTYLSHPWIVANESGKCLRIYFPTKEEGFFSITN